MNGRRGFTVIELVIVGGLTAGLALVCLQLGTQALAATRLASGYSADLLRLRTVTRCLEADARAARTLRVDEGLRLVVGADTISWRLADGRLLRSVGADTTALSDRFARFEARRVGAHLELELALAPRHPRARREAGLTTRVWLRNLEGE